MLAPVNLLVLTALSSLICLAVLGSLARSGMPGIREAVWANVLTICSLAIFAQQASGSVRWLTILLPNLLISAGYSIYYYGICRFLGQRAPVRLLAVGVAVLMGVLWLYLYVWPSTDVRIVAASLLHSFISGGIALAIWRALPAVRSRYSYLFTLAITLTAAIGYLVRAAVYMLGMESVDTLMSPAGWNVAFLTLGVLLSPSVTLGVIMMIHDRMLGDREREASTDFLTGLLTRKAWWRETSRLHAQAQRGERVLTLLALDIDYFKQINDLHGHAAGDAVLQHFARVVGGAMRAGDVVGRLGGEEFSVALPDTPLLQAQHMAQRLMQAVRETPCFYEGRTLMCTVSGGLAQCEPGEPLESASVRADQALYAAKAAGRNCLVMVPPEGYKT
ncbi:membrane protein [Bordetella ansorpii]|uniref:diguanylate cyclase n=1 Tax=Bordetella ansorpii TaxID=288768 RepID=A0A157SKZ1_9BORD|nr:GGDEF domain-containing protein [Bordetella ansorpii]SAI71138.1 membrane protein [Bordetella ansorpii]